MKTDPKKKKAKLVARAEKKINKAKTKGPKKEEKARSKYGYDTKAAIEAGLAPSKEGEHWESRDPKTGRIFKGRKHPSIKETKQGEKELGYKIYRKKGKLYSKKKL
jgi:hypothetical protein